MELIKQIDETVSFNEKNIRIISYYEEPWFVAKNTFKFNYTSEFYQKK